MIQELIWVLPRLVFFEDGVEDFLLGFGFTFLAEIFWRDDVGVDLLWVVVENYDFVDTEDGGGARDAAYLEGLVVGLFGVVEPGAWEGDADGPVAAFGGLEDGGWA